MRKVGEISGEKARNNEIADKGGAQGNFEIRENGGEGAREIERVSIVCLVGNCGEKRVGPSTAQIWV